jgi:hypothetical protein
MFCGKTRLEPRGHWLAESWSQVKLMLLQHGPWTMDEHGPFEIGDLPMKNGDFP